MKKNIYIFTRCIWTFINFRHELANTIDKKKFNVCICMDFDGYTIKYFKKKYPGLKFIDVKFLNKKKKFIFDLKIINEIYKIFNKNKIDIAHNFTARPIVFVTIISIFFKNVEIINTITGLGNNFFEKKKFFYKIIYNLIFLRSKIVVFQNYQDLKIIFQAIKQNINYKVIYPTVKFKKKYLNLKKYKKNKIIFLMHSRMIKQKGVKEYVDAIKKLDNKYKKKSLFYLIGNPDRNNPSSISKKYLDNLRYERDIIYMKHKKNIQNYILRSDVIVLPSYGEGLPASLLEALYFKKAIITTKVNGCIETVKDNFNGILVRPKNSSDISHAIVKLLQNLKVIKQYQQNSYKLYTKKFDNNSIQQYLNIYHSIWKKN